MDHPRNGRRKRLRLARKRTGMGSVAKVGSTGQRYSARVGLIACPFCREMFELGESRACRVCGVPLVAFDKLPVSDDALSEDGIARQLVVDSGADAVTRGEAAAPVVKDALLILENWSHGEAFRDIDLSAGAGEIVALVGVEGSGARELLRSLAGLVPCSGRVEIAGRTGLASRRSWQA